MHESTYYSFYSNRFLRSCKIPYEQKKIDFMPHQFKSPFLQELSWRGFIYQGTDMDTLDQKCLEGPITFYIGYDATATSLHVGNLLTIMAARVAQRHGHKPLILMGGGTTKIGDPSGKDSSRQLMADEKIQANIKNISHVFEKYIDLQQEKALLVNNDVWLRDLNYLTFLRDYGPHFTINRMLTFENVKNRLDREQPLTFLEFNYMIFQAYDFLELNRQHNCILQLGGSDQWGNIVNGVELARRVDSTQVFGLTIPLLTTSSGAKMGKTADGAVWLNADMLSPFDYWQFWRNTEDADVIRFIKLFTDLDQATITPLESLKGADINAAKEQLADAATKLAHGEAALKDVRASIEKVFLTQEADIEVIGMDTEGNPILKTSLPLVQQSKNDLGSLLLPLFVAAGLAKSNAEVRRLIRGGGVKVNDQKITDEGMCVTQDLLQEHSVIKISIGKKNHAYIQFCT